jgi:hypothetical protein
MYILISSFQRNQGRDIKIEVTPARLERGKYIFNRSRLWCHSTRDFSNFQVPKPGTEGMGGDKFDENLDYRVHLCSITPYGVGNWTDGELLGLSLKV